MTDTQVTPPGGGQHRIFTIGHSTRTIEEFVALLEENGILQLADVRRFPASRRLPHFNAAPLAAVLEAHGIRYRHYGDLGGRRPVRADSPHIAWKVDAFRGYADHMETEEFAEALSDLEVWAGAAPTTVMCAEALYFRCHRRLLSDALLRDGWDVRHVTGPRRVETHAFPPFVRIEEPLGRLVYDVGELPLG
jgi:uncharacterized protein (DUF488 family)